MNEENQVYFVDSDKLPPAALERKHRLEQDPSFRTNHMEYMEGMQVIKSDIKDKVLRAMEEYDYDTYTANDVERALSHESCSIEDFKALLSPAAAPYLEQMARKAEEITRNHFGNTVYIFTPLYIANYWTNTSTKDVMVLSNCDEVELFVNGNSVGKLAPNTFENIPHPVFVFKNVKFEEGELKAVGYVDGVSVAEYVRNTPKEASKLVLSADYNTLTADGSDFTQVKVELVDENGTVLPYDKSKVRISVSDLGTFVGEEEIELEGGHTGFIVQSKYNKTGVITCKAEPVDNDAIEPATIEIQVTAFDESNIVPIS